MVSISFTFGFSYTILPVGVTTQSFSPSVNGNYAVEIMQPGGCVVRSSCVQISELGIQSPGTDDEFLLFPNPVDHLVKSSFFG